MQQCHHGKMQLQTETSIVSEWFWGVKVHTDPKQNIPMPGVQTNWDRVTLPDP